MNTTDYWTAELGEEVEIIERPWESGSDYIVRVGDITVDVVESLEAAERLLERMFMVTGREGKK